MDSGLIHAICYCKQGGVILPAVFSQPPMNFVLHAGFRSFLETLKPDTVVYLMAYSQGAGEDQNGYVFASTDLGIDGGTVHALVIRLLDKATETRTPLDIAEEAFSAISKYLVSKHIQVKLGILSTAGLDEVVERWRRSAGYTVKEVHDFFAHRTPQAKASKPAPKNERRRDQDNK
jgi:hypothetical protein